MSVGRGLRGGASAAAAVFVLGVLLWLFGAAPASAHAVLLRSEPGDGSVLAESPRVVRLWFSEEVAPHLGAVELLDAEGRSLGRLRQRGSGSGQPLTFSLPHLGPGVYTLVWRVLSEVDGHAGEGSVVFRVGAGPPPHAAGVAPGEPGPAAAEAVLRWLDLVALAGLVGAVVVGGWVLAPVAPRHDERAELLARARQRAFGVGLAAAILALVAGIGLLVDRIIALSGDADDSIEVLRTMLLGTWWGVLWVAREFILVGLVLTLLFLLRFDRLGPRAARRSVRTLALGAALLLALVVARVLAGHAGAGHSPAVPVTAGAVHVLAASVWVGGLAVLLMVWPWGHPAAGPSSRLIRRCLLRFGSLAALGVGLVVATGVYLAGREVASTRALVESAYGRVLLGKAGLFLLAAAFGLANAVRLRHSSRRPAARRSLVAAEVCLGVGVLAGAGLLGSTAPAIGGGAAWGMSPATLTAGAADLVVTVSVRPNPSGVDVFEVLVANTRRPPPAPIAGVRLRFSGRDGRVVESPPLAEVEPGRYTLGGDYLDERAVGRIDAVVDRPGLDDGVASFAWRGGASATLSAAEEPIEPTLTRLSLTILLTLAASTIWLLFRRHARATRTASHHPAPSVHRARTPRERVS